VTDLVRAVREEDIKVHIKCGRRCQGKLSIACLECLCDVFDDFTEAEPCEMAGDPVSEY
jgi:hypothetical protein